MQKLLEEQRQKMAALWEENKYLNQVKNDFIPGLVKNGLLVVDHSKNEISMVNNWEEHQAQLQKDLNPSVQQAQQILNPQT